MRVYLREQSIPGGLCQAVESKPGAVALPRRAVFPAGSREFSVPRTKVGLGPHRGREPANHEAMWLIRCPGPEFVSQRCVI